MAALIPRYARNGRLKHSFGAPPIPLIWVEIGDEIVPNPDHEIWSLPNTYPLLTLDMRRGRQSNGDEQIFHSEDITPESLANLAQQMTEEYVDAFAPLCRRVGKPLRVAWLVKGFDASPGDTTLFVTEDPYDCGLPGPVNTPGDPMIRPRSILFHARARQHIRTWAEACFAEVADRLVTNELPPPELVVTDIESSPVLEQAFRCNWAVLADRNILGWFEDGKIKAERIPELGDDYVFDGGPTLSEWIASRTTLLDGSDINPSDPSDPAAAFQRGQPQDSPENFDVSQWATAAGQMSYLETLRYGLYEPIKVALGTSVKCGEWALFTDSRAYPINLWPEFFTFWKYGVFGADVQIPVNYGDRLAYFIKDSHTPGTSWPTVTDWLNHLQLNGVAGNSRDLINEAVCSGMVRAAARSNTSRQLLPSVSIVAPGNVVQPYVDEMLPHLLNFMRHSAQLGAAGFWVFAPTLNTDSDIREWTTMLVRSFTQSAMSRRTPRNRMRRAPRA
ncbi:MAG TPA: hypothetical protein PKE29_06220 [Phycisphaerales bacterium]|nr:hypothetical protein [Phycisphaerales bacterium]